EPVASAFGGEVARASSWASAGEVLFSLLGLRGLRVLRHLLGASLRFFLRRGCHLRNNERDRATNRSGRFLGRRFLGRRFLSLLLLGFLFPKLPFRTQQLRLVSQLFLKRVDDLEIGLEERCIPLVSVVDEEAPVRINQELDVVDRVLGRLSEL